MDGCKPIKATSNTMGGQAWPILQGRNARDATLEALKEETAKHLLNKHFKTIESIKKEQSKMFSSFEGFASTSAKTIEYFDWVKHTVETHTASLKSRYLEGLQMEVITKLPEGISTQDMKKIAETLPCVHRAFHDENKYGKQPESFLKSTGSFPFQYIPENEKQPLDASSTKNSWFSNSITKKFAVREPALLHFPIQSMEQTTNAKEIFQETASTLSHNIPTNRFYSNSAPFRQNTATPATHNVGRILETNQISRPTLTVGESIIEAFEKGIKNCEGLHCAETNPNDSLFQSQWNLRSDEQWSSFAEKAWQSWTGNTANNFAKMKNIYPPMMAFIFRVLVILSKFFAQSQYGVDPAFHLIEKIMQLHIS
ncbi:hypothetical protein IE077_004417 [Cardiosporidium cionae]|uniref:Uncharacterized protein n=1 Tax=Cardiosporidium cionae TaxID=476202 RepID=A0ABQ7JAD1_9APIC|nr:hypothetical protein IE077_004417 [Cardiosporidium cionae]|eukprot:KAF8820889.1 hypothetical protein IE077_004417 [Cardiosporidium cionae]